jgi:hypothetical protein
MKQLTLLFAFLFSFAIPQCLSAQEQDDKKREELRQQIGLDYAMPDYNVNKIDEKKIGTHLANMLRFLEKNYKDTIYNQYLSKIRSEQLNDLSLRFIGVDKVNVTGVSKKDNEIDVTIQVISKVSKEICKKKMLITDLHFHFVDGISDSYSINTLFANLNRYAR